MSDLNAKIVADLKRELAEAKAEANRVTESMGSEIMRLHGEIEQQRTRAEAAEQELQNQRDYHRTSMQAAQTTADVALRSVNPLAVQNMELATKLDAIRAHLAGVDVAAVSDALRDRDRAMGTLSSTFDPSEIGTANSKLMWAECVIRNAAHALLAAAREALEP